MARPAAVHIRRPAPRPGAGARTTVAERERAAAFERRLYESFFGLLPGWAIRAVNDPFAFGLSGATPYGSATGTVNDRLAGRDIPIYWNELDLRGYRVLSRQLCDTNQFAIGFTKLLTAFHIRKGYGWQACLKGAKKTPYQTGGAPADPLVEKAQRILDAWRDANCWPLRSREAFRRWARDGEVFGRFFQCGYGRASEFRFVEPEQVGSPTGDTSGDGSFGILNEAGDIEKKLAYHLWRMEAPLEGDWVPADRVVHATKNVDCTIKRGVPDFFPVVEDLEGVKRLLHTMVATAIKQARVAWREKFASATPDRVLTVPTYANTGTNALQPQNLDDFGRAVREQFGRLGVNGWQASDVVKVEGTREYEPGPVMAGAGGFIQAEQAVLRGCGVLWNFPEYFSGDASNNNLASSLVAGSPFVVTVESSQFEWGAVWERPCALKVLELARDAGLLSWEEWSRLDVEVTDPQAATGDPNKDYTTISAQLRDKVICLDTARQKVGVDPQHEAAGVQKDAQTAVPAAGAPGPAGGAGAGTEPGAGLFEGRVRESGPPGPPPRPGLVWNGETHRWRNPETGEEHEHGGGGGGDAVAPGSKAGKWRSATRGLSRAQKGAAHRLVGAITSPGADQQAEAQAAFNRDPEVASAVALYLGAEPNPAALAKAASDDLAKRSGKKLAPATRAFLGRSWSEMEHELDSPRPHQPFAVRVVQRGRDGREYESSGGHFETRADAEAQLAHFPAGPLRGGDPIVSSRVDEVPPPPPPQLKPTDPPVPEELRGRLTARDLRAARLYLAAVAKKAPALLDAERERLGEHLARVLADRAGGKSESAPAWAAPLFESGTATRTVTVHRSDGTTYQRQQKVRTDEPGAGGNEHHEHELSDADRDQIASAIEEDVAALPEDQRPAAGLVAKAKDVAITAAAKLYGWAVNVSTHPAVAKWAPEILEAVFDVPADMAKFGYNPTSAGGQSHAGLGSNDFVRQNLADALGHGVSGHLVASIASKVLVKAAYWVAAKVKGKAAESIGDGLEAWADMMAQLFAHVASELGVDGAMPAADVVEAALRAALGAK